MNVLCMTSSRSLGAISAATRKLPFTQAQARAYWVVHGLEGPRVLCSVRIGTHDDPVPVLLTVIVSGVPSTLDALLIVLTPGNMSSTVAG